MNILHKLVANKGVFYVEENGKIEAEMVYNQPSPDKMIIEHTEVSDVLRGKNVGFQLVKAAVEYSREKHLKIIPLCPFAKSVFDKKPEFHDVLISVS